MSFWNAHVTVLSVWTRDRGVCAEWISKLETVLISVFANENGAREHPMHVARHAYVIM